MPVEGNTEVTVLVEGESDAIAVRALLARDGASAAVRSMDGVTNIDRWLDQVVQDVRVRHVYGLYDRAEERFVLRALHRRGIAIEETQPLSAHGFFVCDRDLEDELIRAVGADRVAATLDDIGLAGSFETFSQQPQWRDEPLDAQLHRFAGAGSGRKSLIAGHLVAMLTPATTPAPLADLVAGVLHTAGSDGPPPR